MSVADFSERALADEEAAEEVGVVTAVEEEVVTAAEEEAVTAAEEEVVMAAEGCGAAVTEATGGGGQKWWICWQQEQRLPRRWERAQL